MNLELINISRIVALVLLGVAIGLLARYYFSRLSKLNTDNLTPFPMFVGYLCFGFALAAEVVSLIGDPSAAFKWWITPFITVGSIAIIIGLKPHLKIKKE